MFTVIFWPKKCQNSFAIILRYSFKSLLFTCRKKVKQHKFSFWGCKKKVNNISVYSKTKIKHRFLYKKRCFFQTENIIFCFSCRKNQTISKTLFFGKIGLKLVIFHFFDTITMFCIQTQLMQLFKDVKFTHRLVFHNFHSVQYWPQPPISKRP